MSLKKTDIGYDKDKRAVILLDSLIGFEYKHKIKILSLVGSPSLLFEKPKAVRDYLSECAGEAKANTVLSAITDKDYEKAVFAELESVDAECVTLYEDRYPALLKETDLPPLVLYCNGNVDLLGAEYPFAIVGSRKCLPNALTLATDFARTLSEKGVTIVTGSAGGADEAAAKGAFDSGRLVSVIAGGIKHVYPAYNKNFIEAVAKKGLVVSEQPPDCQPKPWMFPMRNRIIAGLAKGTLIVGGDKKSGARHTAERANFYGREVFCFPYSIGIASGELCNSLIKDGAFLCDDVNDVLCSLGITEETIEEKAIELDGDEYDVYSAIKDGFDDVNKIVVRTNKKMHELAPILSMLEIEGYIVKLAGNKYKAVK